MSLFTADIEKKVDEIKKELYRQIQEAAIPYDLDFNMLHNSGEDDIIFVARRTSDSFYIAFDLKQSIFSVNINPYIQPKLKETKYMFSSLNDTMKCFAALVDYCNHVMSLTKLF